MQTQSIMLLDGSRFLRDVLRRVIDKTPGLQIVADIADYTDFPSVANRVEADWVILVLSPGEKTPDIVREFIDRYSSLHWMTIEPDGGRVKLRWLEPFEVSLNEKNLQEILHILVENRPLRHLEDRV
jgi:hypothetical protein